MEKFSILIVEDSSFVSNTLKSHFEEKGHSCQQAFTLAETLHTLDLFTFDYIVLDLHLPDAEEERLIMAIQDKVKAKIFVITDESDRQVRELIFRYGIIDYFLKDDSFQMNIDLINSLMQTIPENSKHNILCVDDSKLAQKHIAMTLGPRNYSLLAAYTAQEAQEYLGSTKISLIILDMELPDLHGSKLLKLIKVNKKFNHIPIIILSGTISPDIVSMVIKAGANDYIEKPFNTESLMLKASRLIDEFAKDQKIIELNKALSLQVQQEVAKNQAHQVVMLHQSKLAQMGEMLSMIAHQWRQPLSAITAVTANLIFLNIQEKIDGDIINEEAAKIEQYALYLSNTISDFRNFFKTDLEKKLTNFDGILKNVFDIILTSLEAKNIKVVYENLSDTKIVTFPNELKHVILNLIKNSEDALLDRSTVSPCIEIKIYKSGESMVYEQYDNGGGIDESIMNQIFDPYFSTKRDKDGTGLGLYMSKIIIEEHCKGDILVKNHRDGTLFKIRIPSQE